MNNKTPHILSPEACASKIFEMSGAGFEPDIADGLWSKIINHKWLLSEKVGANLREVIEEFEKDSISYSRV